MKNHPQVQQPNIDPRSIKVPKPPAPPAAPMAAPEAVAPAPLAAELSPRPGALDDPSPPSGPTAAVEGARILEQQAVAQGPTKAGLGKRNAIVLAIDSIMKQLRVDQHGGAFVMQSTGSNPVLLAIGSGELNTHLRRAAAAKGERLTAFALVALNDELRGSAELDGARVEAFRRVGRSDDGAVVIDLCDDANGQAWIQEGSVRFVDRGSNVVFARSSTALPMVVSKSGFGDHRLLGRHLNVDAVGLTLLVAWLTYTLAHPKAPGVVFVILVIHGGQGSGKSVASRMLARLVDPNRIGLQVMPKNVSDLAIAMQGAHVLAFDNVREISTSMSDYLCIAATGGDVAKRKLYTDGEQHAQRLHGAAILNGIPSFVDWPDLAQRCLVIRLQPIPEAQRKSEVEVWKDFEADLPSIQRGLFDLMAATLERLPEAKVTHPARMLDFCKWLAAMELVHGAPTGTYQQEYLSTLNQGQLDSLQETILGSTLLDCVDSLTSKGAEPWEGTPSKLLSALESSVDLATQRSRDWPGNAIALSKRLQFLQAAFITQGVSITFTRGKERAITIRKIGGAK